MIKWDYEGIKSY